MPSTQVIIEKKKGHRSIGLPFHNPLSMSLQKHVISQNERQIVITRTQSSLVSRWIYDCINGTIYFESLCAMRRRQAVCELLQWTINRTASRSTILLCTSIRRHQLPGLGWISERFRWKVVANNSASLFIKVRGDEICKGNVKVDGCYGWSSISAWRVLKKNIGWLSGKAQTDIIINQN